MSDIMCENVQVFVRTTLPEMDEAVALTNLTFPGNFFNLTAEDMGVFCGILAEDARQKFFIQKVFCSHTSVTH